MAQKGSRPAYERAGFATQNAYQKARRKAQAWSDEHSHQSSSEYRPRMSPESFRVYYGAFVSDVTSTRARRDRGLTKSPFLEEWLVDEVEEYSPQEFAEYYRDLE